MTQPIRVSFCLKDRRSPFTHVCFYFFIIPFWREFDVGVTHLMLKTLIHTYIYIHNFHVTSDFMT